MGNTLETSIEINAPPAKVWQVLTDVSKFPEWNPFLKAIEGELKEGEYINVTFSNGFKISPRLLKLETDKELRWKGKLLFGGLFDGEHHFRLTSVGDNKTKFDHGEAFSGILIPIAGSLLKETAVNFAKMNEALKARCESA